jgi:NET1-associated nuclear protein 1 (U3 small nucleolar RNA-associated protein 17)
VGTQHGDISLYDWTTGRWLSTVKAGNGVEIQTVCAARFGRQEDAVYTVEKQPEATQNGKQKEGAKPKHRHVLMLRKASASGIEDISHQLHETRGRLRHIRVLDNRNTIVLAGDEQMIVGSLADGGIISDALGTEGNLDTSYRWRKSTTTQSITCIDTFSRHVTIRLPSGEIQKRISHAIALGNTKGEVLIYDDVVEELEKLETAGKSRSLVPRILRWHREAPNTVKWSKDGKKICETCSRSLLITCRQLCHLWRQRDSAMPMAARNGPTTGSTSLDSRYS